MRNDGGRVAEGREQQSPPPPISTMHCRSKPTKGPRCVVGKKSTMRCRFAASLLHKKAFGAEFLLKVAARLALLVELLERAASGQDAVAERDGGLAASGHQH